MKAHIDQTSAMEPCIFMSRTFDAPREKIWEAFTKPEHVVRWYGGHGFSNPVCEMDVRPGGHWRHVMRTPDGSEHPLDLVFLEVVKPEKLVWQDRDFETRPGGGPPASRITVTLADRGQQTDWHMVARFASFEARDMAVQIGFAETVAEGAERLAGVVASLLKTAPESSARELGEAAE